MASSGNEENFWFGVPVGSARPCVRTNRTDSVARIPGIINIWILRSNRSAESSHRSDILASRKKRVAERHSCCLLRRGKRPVIKLQSESTFWMSSTRTLSAGNERRLRAALNCQRPDSGSNEADGSLSVPLDEFLRGSVTVFRNARLVFSRILWGRSPSEFGNTMTVVTVHNDGDVD